ncbi:hypothetical protein EPYR_02060 [Erwinia pyrifoliae DSM 12163]|nr:hypothetical protein EPYR_02060 [Erwinia pyrifoliae DSM 12163]
MICLAALSVSVSPFQMKSSGEKVAGFADCIIDLTIYSPSG